MLLIFVTHNPLKSREGDTDTSVYSLTCSQKPDMSMDASTSHLFMLSDDLPVVIIIAAEREQNVPDFFFVSCLSI